MLPVKHTVIYTFFAITSVQNTCFCSVFNALASKNPAKSCYVQCFFHFWPFFHCRKATKMTQNSISIPSCAQTPKNPRKMSKTPPYSGLGAKPFLAPPAKADIATAILTNVIEHLVLLFCPPISTPSPPKRCGRIFWTVLCDFHAIYLRARLRGRRLDGPRCRPQEAAAALGLGPDNSCFLGSSTLLLAQAELGDIESCSTGSCNSQLKVFYSENLKMMTPLFSVLVLQLATTEPDQPITDAPTTK